MFIVESEGHFGTCLIGEGETVGQAWFDAYGPKPYSSYVIMLIRKSWATEVTKSELAKIKFAQGNK